MSRLSILKLILGYLVDYAMTRWQFEINIIVCNLLHYHIILAMSTCIAGKLKKFQPDFPTENDCAVFTHCDSAVA